MDERKDQARWLALLVAVAICLYGCWLLFRPFVGVVTWALVLAVTFNSMHQRIRVWAGNRTLGALLATAIVIVAVLLPVSITVLAVARELPDLIRKAQDAFSGLLDPETAMGRVLLPWLEPYLDVAQLRSAPIFANMLENFDTLALAVRAFGLVGGTVAGVVQAVFVLFVLYYLFRDGDQLVSWLPQVLPLKEAQSKELFRRIREMIDASVYGVLVVAVVQGTLGGLAFWALGLPNALVWGAVMILLSVIPVAGSFVVWVPAAAYLALTGSWLKALILTAWGLLAIGLIDNLMRPIVMGQKARMHELLLFFSVLGGIIAFGVPGLILGPVLVAVALGLLDVLRQTGGPAEAIRRQPSLAEQTATISEGSAPEVVGTAAVPSMLAQANK